MLLADSNIWLALSISNHVFYSAAHAWFARVKPAEPVLFCRATQQSFLRLISTSAVLTRYGLPPLTNQAAWTMYESYLADDRIDFVEEPRRADTIWKKLTNVPTPSPKLWMDAYLAAFVIAGGYRLVTTDRGFKQFKGLDVVLLSDK